MKKKTKKKAQKECNLIIDGFKGNVDEFLKTLVDYSQMPIIHALNYVSRNMIRWCTPSIPIVFGIFCAYPLSTSSFQFRLHK